MFVGRVSDNTHNSAKLEDARTCVEKIKSEMIASQRSVVKLQQQMLEANQLKTMSSVVDTAVTVVWSKMNTYPNFDY